MRVGAPGFTPYSEIAEHLAGATVGIVPYEETSGGHCAFVAKLVEYIGVGVPVVSTKLEGVAGYFSNEPVITFTDFNGKDFGDALLRRLRDPMPGGFAAAKAASERVVRELDWGVVTARAVDAMETVGRRR